VRAAVLHEYGVAPRFGDFDAPSAGEGEVVVEVAAAGLHHLDLHKATGTFYMGPPPLPSVVGTDGVGRLPDGRRAYFDATVAPFGSMAERALVPEAATFDIAEGVDDAVAAALGNTGLGAWLALAWRSGLEPGQTVLVLGATGAVGSIAVQAAKLLGAGRVVAAARDPDAVAGQGADEVVPLRGDDAEALREATQGGADLTIDPLWGEPAAAAVEAAAFRGRIVHLGQSAAPESALRSGAVRGKALDIRGFPLAAAPQDEKARVYRLMLEHAAAGRLRIEHETLPLERVAEAWERQAAFPHGKLVLRP
jgi:NADPH:quinone reductase-like Zn-dependent oxidoreductase